MESNQFIPIESVKEVARLYKGIIFTEVNYVFAVSVNILLVSAGYFHLYWDVK